MDDFKLQVSKFIMGIQDYVDILIFGTSDANNEDEAWQRVINSKNPPDQELLDDGLEKRFRKAWRRRNA